MRRTSPNVKTAVRRAMLGDRIASPGAGPSVVKRTALAALAVVVEHLELFQVAINQKVSSSEEVYDHFRRWCNSLRQKGVDVVGRMLDDTSLGLLLRVVFVVGAHRVRGRIGPCRGTGAL